MTRVFLLSFLLLSALNASAYKSGSCAESQQRRYRAGMNAKSTIASSLLEMYDVKYVKLDLAMNNLSTDVAGNATTRAVVTSSTGMGKYVFELDSNLTIDSAMLNNVLLPVVKLSDNVYSITPPTPIGNGITFTAQIFYHGKAISGTGFFTHGINHNKLSTGTEITFSLSDMYLARDWWPCKQSLTDKIDSADLWFTVPNGTKAGSNGRLLAVTPIGTTSSRYQWKTTYPIDYYLICVAIAPYVDHTQMLHFTGSSDSMPVQHFVYDTATFYPLYKSAIDSTPIMVDYFSTLYGRYPFWKEKYGHCIAPLSGGMEHQTMTTLGAFQTPLIAHELGHQWWGDCVTYTSWKDIWMSEGWAAHTEQLYVEHFRSVAEAINYRTAVFNRVVSAAGGSLIVPDADTMDAGKVFNSRLTYDKGAAVAHMLRYVAPSDSVFFSGLRAYLQQYAFRTASTAEFKAVMETAYGHPLDTFFNQWVYGEGYPTYSAGWNQIGNTVYIRLDQTTSVPSSVAAFSMPVTLKLTSTTGDTLVNVYFNTAQQIYTFNWGRTMAGMTIDPDNHIVNRTGLVTSDATLSAGTIPGAGVLIYPNPASDSWQVSGLTKGSSLKLMDVHGRVIWQKANAAAKLTIAADTLAPGIYTLSITDIRGKVQSRTIEKR